MAVPFVQASFAKGEISPELWGHVDLQSYHVAASTLRNMFVSYKGGAFSRAGTRYAGTSMQTLVQPPPRIINWAFNNTQGYVLEFGDNYVRIYYRGGRVVEVALTLASITEANPAVITTTAPHNYAAGDWVVFNLSGMPMLNSNDYIVGAVVSSTSFTITDVQENTINTAGASSPFLSGTVARVYTIASPYAASDLRYLKFVQSADVMSLTCINPPAGMSYPPYELKRLGSTNWTLQPASFAAGIAAPATCSVTATTAPTSGTSPPVLPCAYAYVVTAVSQSTGEESEPSPIGNVTNGVDMAATAGSNIVTWSPVANAAFYNVYRAPTSYNTEPGNTGAALPVPIGALFGLVASALGTQLVDSNLTPDFSQSPPQHRNPFAPGQITYLQMTSSSADWTTANIGAASSTGTGFSARAVIVNNAIVAAIIENAGQGYIAGDSPVFSGDGSSAAGVFTIGPQTGTYPGVVSYFQQRRTYAQTLNLPDTYNMSQPGSYLNFDVSIPVNDSDAISGTPWAEKISGIQWMVSMPLGLLTFTGSGVWQVGAPGSSSLSSPAALTPTNQVAAPQSSIGCSETVPPLRVNWDVLYLESYGNNVLDLSYQIWFNIYAGTDISWSSSHLLQNHEIIEWCYARNPWRLIWAVRNDGILLSLTYLKEQEVVGWARHDTLGQVASICSCTEPPTDAVYLVVQRPIGNVRQWCIERMDDRLWTTVEDAWCVDCAIGSEPSTAEPGQPGTQAILFATSTNGPVEFYTATPGTFSAAAVGQILRMGGGIAEILTYGGTQQVFGLWVYPCQQLLPNDPQHRPMPALPGQWSLTPQLTTVFGGLHLAGQQVMGLADGVPFGPVTVSSVGSITLPFPASNVKFGLGFTAQAQSIYADTGQPTIQGRRKSIYAVTARLMDSAFCQIGANEPNAAAISPPPLFTEWGALPQGSAENVDPPPPSPYTTVGGARAQPVFTGDYRVVVKSEWQKRGMVAVQQTAPLPVNLLAFFPEALEGDLPEAVISPQELPRRQPARRAA